MQEPGGSAHVAEWVAAHPHSRETIDNLQKRAQDIMATKIRTRQARDKGWKGQRLTASEQAQADHYSDSDEYEEIPLETKGVTHLKRLQLVPDSFGRRTETTEKMQSTMQTRLKTGRHELSHTDANVDVVHYEGGSKLDGNVIGEECACGTKAKVKSGKYAKSNVNIVRQELWPHLAVSKKYIKRTSFDNLEFNAFVAGEMKILQNMFQNNDQEAVGRLRVLSQIAHWTGRVKDWPSVRALYESIVEEIELGESTWLSDFGSYKTMLPVTTVQTDHIRSIKKGTEIYWCKQYQTGNCDLVAPHIAQIRSDENPVLVMHICGYCWTNFKKRKDHMENECSAKK